MPEGESEGHERDVAMQQLPVHKRHVPDTHTGVTYSLLFLFDIGQRPNTAWHPSPWHCRQRCRYPSFLSTSVTR